MAVKLELYRVFQEVARMGNISAAAQNLYISQSAVSQSIKQLEEQLQVRLFSRSTRGVVLTSEGKMLLDYVSHGLGLIQCGEEKLAQSRQLLTGELIFMLGLFLYEPFRADRFDGLKHFKCKWSVGADDHSFLYDFRLFGAERFIVGNDICCQFFESVRVTENCRHATHGPFAFLDLLRIGAFGSTLLIVLLDFFGLFVRYDNTGQSLSLIHI